MTITTVLGFSPGNARMTFYLTLITQKTWHNIGHLEVVVENCNLSSGDQGHAFYVVKIKSERNISSSFHFRRQK